RPYGRHRRQAGSYKGSVLFAGLHPATHVLTGRARAFLRKRKRFFGINSQLIPYLHSDPTPNRPAHMLSGIT
ncbi:hypothetical protein, partial [Pseudomonas gingeri]